MKKKTNILYVSRTSKITGPENILLDMIKKLDKNIFCPAVALPDNKGPFYKKLKEYDFTVMIIRMPFLRVTYNPFLLLWFLLNIVFVNLSFYFILKRENIDIAVCNTIQEALYVAVPARILRKKLIVCFKNILDKNWKKYVRARFCGMFADKIIAVSKKAAEDYTSFNFKSKSQKNKISIINDGIEYSKYIKDFKKIDVLGEYLNKKKREFVILNIGNLTELKGQSLLLEAAAILNSSNIEFKVFIVGDVYHWSELTYKNRLKNYITYNNLSKKVIMLGYREDVRNLINGADILVHCPIKEDAFPRVILEAFCFQKVVLATVIGGIPEMIEDNYNGFLCKINAKDLAERILYIYNNRAKLDFIGRNAVKAVKEDFSLKKQVLETEKLYKELLNIN